MSFEPNRILKSRLLDLLTEKERRERRRIPQSEIADAIGVKKHTIGNWIYSKNLNKLEKSVIERLCTYFDCDIGDLLYFEPVESED